MSSYAVLWQRGRGEPVPGRLEFDPDGLWLQGGNRGSEVRVEIPYDEIVTANRDPFAHIGRRHAIRVESRAAGALLLASVGAVGELSEIFDTIQRAAL
jgi:hypothetical protein